MVHNPLTSPGAIKVGGFAISSSHSIPSEPAALARTVHKEKRPVSLAAKQKSHRPGRPLALSLPRRGTCTGILAQTGS